jgi:hypothetical protein
VFPPDHQRRASFAFCSVEVSRLQREPCKVRPLARDPPRPTDGVGLLCALTGQADRLLDPAVLERELRVHPEIHGLDELSRPAASRWD